MTQTHIQHPSLDPPAYAANKNWLLTSAGAKVDLTRRMRSALHHHHLKLYTCDISTDSAAFHFDDGHFLLPANSADIYLPTLINACRQHDIAVILPTRDDDLLTLTSHRHLLNDVGIWVLASSAETIQICLDKVRFHQHCLNHQLPALPRLETPTPSEFPLFVRQRRGSGSNNARCVNSLTQLQALFESPPWNDYLIQPVCKLPEYSIDAIFDRYGHPLQWVSRERIRVRAGESVVSRTCQIPALDNLVSSMAQTLHLVGPVTMQVFYAPDNGPYLIEVNPRFGGASALGIEAGLKTPERLVAWAQGDVDSFRQCGPINYNLKMLRYSQDLFC